MQGGQYYTAHCQYAVLRSTVNVQLSGQELDWRSMAPTTFVGRQLSLVLGRQGSVHLGRHD